MCSKGSRADGPVGRTCRVASRLNRLSPVSVATNSSNRYVWSFSKALVALGTIWSSSTFVCVLLKWSIFLVFCTTVNLMQVLEDAFWTKRWIQITMVVSKVNNTNIEQKVLLMQPFVLFLLVLSGVLLLGFSTVLLFLLSWVWENARLADLQTHRQTDSLSL